MDVDRTPIVELAATALDRKVNIRRLIEAEGIPYTYVISHGFLHFMLHKLGQLESTIASRDKVTIIGDGNL